MKENMPHIPETKSETEVNPEKILTAEQVLEYFSTLTTKELKEERRKIDDEGNLYILEVTVPGDQEGQTIEFAYMRKGRRAEGGGISETNIHVTYYDGGQPISGTVVARYLNNQWELVPDQWKRVNDKWELVP